MSIWDQQDQRGLDTMIRSVNELRTKSEQTSESVGLAKIERLYGI